MCIRDRAVSAPVFAEVAQQVLEYLGVSHDIDVRPPSAAAKKDAPVVEDAQQHSGDIEALYAAANDLPADDPLRAAPDQASASSQPATQSANSAAEAKASAGGAQAAQSASQPAAPRSAKQEQTASGQPATTAVVVADPKKLQVPSLIGLPVRKVIELTAAAGLEVQITGNGTVREQAPAPGTMVAPGTQIVVRCGR